MTALAAYNERLLWEVSAGDLKVPFVECQAVMSIAFRLRGQLDREALRYSIRDVLAHHPSLRASYVLTAAGLIRQIGDEPAFSLAEWKASEQTVQERERAAVARVLEDSTIHVDASPLCRAHALEIGATDTIVCFEAHHLLADTRSLHIVMRDIARRYNCLVRGTASAGNRPASDGYAEYAASQRTLAAACEHQRIAAECKEAIENSLYWDQRATRCRRDPEVKGQIARSEFEIPTELTVELKRVSRSVRTTPAILTLALFTNAIHRLCGTRDTVILMLISDRLQQQFDDTVGLFTNAIPVPTSINSSQSFTDVVAGVHASVLRRYEGHRLPYGKFVSLQPDLAARVRLVFSYRSEKSFIPDFDGLLVTPVLTPRRVIANADVSLHVHDTDGGLRCHCLHDPAVTDLTGEELRGALVRTFTGLWQYASGLG